MSKLIGILTEKPSASRNFAKALGGMKGTYNGENYVIVASRGHLYEFVDPVDQVQGEALQEKYRSWSLQYLPWDEKDFIWKKKAKKDTKDTLKAIKDGLSPCDEIVIATDDDPTGEGELLAWEILDALKFHPAKWSRMYFTDEAPNSIQKAFKNRVAIKSMKTDMDYVKADLRSKTDYMSMQHTRIATKCGDGHSVLRQGRLKSVMVKFVGDALKAYTDYKKIPYYQNRFKDENGVTYSDPNAPTYKTRGDVPGGWSSSPVIVDGKQLKSTPPPKLLDLAGMSALLSSKGIKAKAVLDVYQKMYEDQVVSYPRTEDKTITQEQFDELLPKINAIAKVVGVDTKLLTHRTARSTHVKNQGAHGANRPGPNVPNSLDDLKKYGSIAPAIYTILAKNFLAMFGEDYEYELQKGHLEKYPSYKGSVSVPKKMGYKAIFNNEDPDENENANGLGTKADPFVYEGFPPRPPKPTMKWLMKQLEKYDVGTGATRTSIYAEVTSEKANYPLLKETKGALSMTSYGEMSYALLPGTHIGDVKFTELLMQQMRDVAAGKVKPEDCLAAFQQVVIDDMKIMQENANNAKKEGTVKMGNSEQVERVTGVWNGKQVSFKKVWSGHEFTQSEIDDLLAGKTIVIEAVSSKSGKTFQCEGKLSEQEYNGKTYVGFENLGFIASFPDEWCEHKFTPDEKSLLEAGQRVSITAKSKKGKDFTTEVSYENGRIVPHFND